VVEPLPELARVAADLTLLIETLGRDSALLAALGVERRG
jgi:hypothetical protein